MSPSARSTDNEVKVLRSHIFKDWQPVGDEARDWNSLSEYPSAHELIGEDESGHPGHIQLHAHDWEAQIRDNLPHNPIHCPWPSTTAYLETHYRLNREQMVSPLRRAIGAVRDCPRMMEEHRTWIYTKVHISGYILSNQGPAVRLEFLPNRTTKKINWETSKRLSVGRLVALSPEHDMFRSICSIGVVADRRIDALQCNPPSIGLFWAGINNVELDPAVSYMMVESAQTYFESERHMLVAIQKLSTERFPLSDYLVHTSREQRTPHYVETAPYRNLEPLLSVPTLDSGFTNVDILRDWPDSLDSTLNSSQLGAVRSMLTREVSLVQGPPGCGKTFVSVNALRVMIESLGEGDPPIIISAETNHALDQLLTLVGPYDEHFVRLGARYSRDNDLIHQHSLFELRKTKADKIHNNLRKAATGKIQQLQGEVRSFFKDNAEHDVLEPLKLLQYNIISDEQYTSLMDSEWVTSSSETYSEREAMMLWAGDELIPSHNRCPTHNLGALDDEEEEETDFIDGIGLDIIDGENLCNNNLFGPVVELQELMTGKPSRGLSDAEIQRMLSENHDLYNIRQQIRGSVYSFLQRRHRERQLPELKALFTRYASAVNDLRLANWQSDLSLIKNLRAKIVGCTTTGLAKYRGIISALAPRVLLLEEAAQSLEARVISGMIESLEHLILVGDHQQLRAHTASVYLDQKPFNLAVSTFERLIQNHLPFDILNEQRRMVPEIRQLVTPFYPDLTDHTSVLDLRQRPPVPGSKQRTYFFHHTWPETLQEGGSVSNRMEAQMIVELVKHILLNGVKASDVTVLTYYRGQRQEIRNQARTLGNLGSFSPKHLKISTIDSYQGEENDVILLSLVRSNEHGQIGFVKDKNRAVVALSRARRGLYVFGNVRNLLAPGHIDSTPWKQIAGIFHRSGTLSSSFPVFCEKHNVEVCVREPDDWRRKGLVGGCHLKCSEKLRCGHSCPYNCHPFSHDEVVCAQKCSLQLPCGHRCREHCQRPCVCVRRCKVRPSSAQPALVQKMIDLSLDDVLGGGDEHELLLSLEHHPHPGERPSPSPQPASTRPETRATISDLTYTDTFTPVTIERGERVRAQHSTTTRFTARDGDRTTNDASLLDEIQALDSVSELLSPEVIPSGEAIVVREDTHWMESEI